MPLQKVPGPQYLHRERIFVDPYIDNLEPSTNGKYDNIVVEIASHPDRVTAIELTNYCFSQQYAPGFVHPVDDIPGSNWLDIRMVDHPAEAHTLEFSVQLPSLRFASNQELIDYLPGYLDEQMDDQGDAFFDTALGVSFSVLQSQEFLYTGNIGAIVIVAQIGGVPDTIQLYWLFDSGSNSANAANVPLGFPSKVDVGGPQTINGTFITYPMPTTYWKMYPHRYVDTNLDKVPEFKPHARIFLTPTSDFRRTRENVSGVRLMVEPIRRLDFMRITLTLAQGAPTSIVSNRGYGLVYDMLLVSPEPVIPDWVQQYLGY